MSQPRVTISILSYHRREALERVLDSARAQRYPDLETIVVDNGSGEELTGWILRQYPEVRLIALPENSGTAARNKGLECASGDIVVMLDNDVSLDGPNAVERVVEGFERHPRAGCLAFRVYHPETGRLHARDWCHPRPWQQAELEEFETYFITEGACAFRREVFDAVEGYWPALWIGHEGFDLAVRLMDAGYEIWYAPEVKVWHRASRETRENWRPFYFNTRNLFLVLYRDYPWRAGLVHLAPRLAVLGFYAARHGWLWRYCAALRDGLGSLGPIVGLRRPVCRATLRKIAAMKKFQPSWWARFKRHWSKPEF